MIKVLIYWIDRRSFDCEIVLWFDRIRHTPNTRWKRRFKPAQAMYNTAYEIEQRWLCGDTIGQILDGLYDTMQVKPYRIAIERYAINE